MRRHAKAPTAGSTKRQATGLGRFFRGAFATRHGSPRAKGSGAPKARALVLAAAVLALVLALAVGSASGSTTRFFEEVFGSAAEPSFSADRGLAYDQGAEHLYVIDSTADVLYRFNADGSAANFSELGSNEIDGEGGAGEDETAHGHLAFESNDEREQVAIDESGEGTDGNVYVTQASSDVIDIFSEAGEYLGQLSESTEGGAFGEPCGVAVDGEGTVYVGDRGDDLIHIFDPEAAAAAPVNADSAAESIDTLSNPCSLAAGAGETAGFLFVNQSFGSAHKVDATTGEVKYEIASSVNTLSVDPTTGHVFTAHSSSTGVTEYDASEAAEATLVSSFKPGSTTEGVAVDSASNQVFVARSSTENVEVFGAPTIVPDVETEEPSANTGTRATLAGTVNPDGVELDECLFEWTQQNTGSAPPSYENTVPCAETPAEIGAGTTPVAVHADISGLAPQGVRYHSRLVATNPNGTINGNNVFFSTPDTVIVPVASPVAPTEATLNGTVNPDMATISECVFEWGTPKEPGASIQTFPETAPCVPGPGGITGESPVAVEAELSGLHPGTTYVYRLRVGYPTGPVVVPPNPSTPATFQTTGPVIEGAWSEDVVRTEATLKAAIDPEGSATTYGFEWGETEAYGSESEGNVGSDSSVHEVTAFLEGLQPDTTYHYRVTATSGVAENVGPDQTFTTYPPFVQDADCPNQTNRYGAAAGLPDCRAYEMVSPVDKNGGDIRSGGETGGVIQRWIQSSLDGDKLTYSSKTAFGDAPSGLLANQYIADRGAGGWSTRSINAPQGLTTFGNALPGDAPFVNRHLGFSPDLSKTWLFDYNATPLGPGTVEGLDVNFYEGDLAAGTYKGLGLGSSETGFSVYTSQIPGFSDDLGTVFIVRSNESTQKLFVYDGDEPRLAGIRPDGTAADNSAAGASLFFTDTTAANFDSAVSRDGSRVFFTTGPTSPIYVRENPTEEQSALVGEECTEPAKACTRQISPGSAFFWAGSSDGSAVLYAEGSQVNAGADQYLHDLDSEVRVRLGGESSGIVGQSEDLSRVYFVSEEDLAPGAKAGERNLYLYREGAPSFIAVLSQDDTIFSYGPGSSRLGVASGSPFLRTSRVTPDGEALVFMSDRSLTGYDNRDIDTGEPVSEVYRYDAVADELTCVSCNPSGVRPKGETLGLTTRTFLSDKRGAAWIPGWEHSDYASNVLSEDGERVFFNSFDALVPRDTNNQQDVYQWGAQGSGTCEEPGGCVDLISTGQSPSNAEFLDASPDGRDVFFETKSSILSEDPGLIDIYDARAGGGFPPPPPPEPPCLGDACQSVPSAPEDPTPASESFRGPEDPRPRANCGARARRAAKNSRRAKRLRRAAKRSRNQRRSKALRRKSKRYARNAKRLSRNAKRCRRANRRAKR